MLVYFLRRLALIIPTLFGVLLLTFVVLQFVPGGPVEQYLMEAKSAGAAGLRGAGAAGGSGAEGSSIYQGQRGVDPERLAQIQALYGFDRGGWLRTQNLPRQNPPQGWCWAAARSHPRGLAPRRFPPAR